MAGRTVVRPTPTHRPTLTLSPKTPVGSRRPSLLGSGCLADRLTSKVESTGDRTLTSPENRSTRPGTPDQLRTKGGGWGWLGVQGRVSGAGNRGRGHRNVSYLSLPSDGDPSFVLQTPFPILLLTRTWDSLPDPLGTRGRTSESPGGREGSDRPSTDLSDQQYHSRSPVLRRRCQSDGPDSLVSHESLGGRVEGVSTGRLSGALDFGFSTPVPDI